MVPGDGKLFDLNQVLHQEADSTVSPAQLERHVILETTETGDLAPKANVLGSRGVAVSMGSGTFQRGWHIPGGFGPYLVDDRQGAWHPWGVL